MYTEEEYDKELLRGFKWGLEVGYNRGLVDARKEIEMGDSK